MKIFVTEIRAIHPHTGELVVWNGDRVEAPSMGLAQQWCDQNKGYLKVVGQLMVDIPCKEGTNEPDFSKKIDYDITESN